MAHRAQTTNDVLRYMRARPGQILLYGDVAADINQPRQNVNNALVRAVKAHPEWGIERRGSGQYVFLPEKQTDTTPEPEKESPTQSLYEGVGVTKDGTRIVRDTEGVLWKLSERL